MSTTVHIWDSEGNSGSSKRSYGHAAIEFGSHYASIWPMEKWHEQVVTSHSTDCWLMGDRSFRRPPSSSIRVGGLDEDAMVAFWKASKKRLKYNELLLNCSTLSAKILLLGFKEKRLDRFSVMLKVYRPRNLEILLGLFPILGFNFTFDVLVEVLQGDSSSNLITTPASLKKISLLVKDLIEK